jgi:putative PIN family toxin of toxin-antitoxin system
VKIVLDTNVIASGVYWKGSSFEIIQRWTTDQFQVFITGEILNEYKTILEKLDPVPTKPVAQHWIPFIFQNSVLVTTKTSVKICRDPDDDKILDCALAAEAKYIVSGDKDLLSLGRFRSVEIITPPAFLKILQK